MEGQEQNDHQHHHRQHTQHHEAQHEGRPILVAVDHSLYSKQAFDWVLCHLCRPHDTLHLLHVLPDGPKDHSIEESPRALYESTSKLMERFAAEAYEAAMVKTEVLILTGAEVGKAIVQESRRISPIAVVIGKKDRGLIKSVLHGSVSEYCSHHCPYPLVLVPPKEISQQSVGA